MAKKQKPMTNAQKKQRAELRKDMRARGYLPPIKKPLNRKKFIADAQADYQETIRLYSDIHVIGMAFSWMLATSQPTLETVGAAKVLKLSAEIKRFLDEAKANGKEPTYVELYEHIRPIIEA